MLFAFGRTTEGNFPNSSSAWLYARLGWRVLAEDRMKLATAPDPTAFVHAQIGETVRLRWRGAAAEGAGTGFRNRHWTSAAATSRHVPLSFKGNAVAAAFNAAWAGASRLVGTLLGA